MTIPTTIERYLKQNNIAYELTPHRKTGSTRESAVAAHVREDHIAKAVMTKDTHGYLMAVIPGDQWLRLRALQQELNRHLELVPESEVDGLFTDCQPGAIPPLGQLYGIETVVDEALTTLANVYLEAGDHEHLIHIGADQFHTLTSGLRHGHYGHSEE